MQSSKRGVVLDNRQGNEHVWRQDDYRAGARANKRPQGLPSLPRRLTNADDHGTHTAVRLTTHTRMRYPFCNLRSPGPTVRTHLAMFTVTPPTKRAASPSSLRTAKHPRTSFSPTAVSDSALRSMVKNLSKEQLQSVIMQTAQFHPTAKQSIHSLVSSMQVQKARDFKSEVSECLSLMSDGCARLRPPKLSERASEICAMIEQTVQTIVGGVQDLTRNSDHGGEDTRRRAVDTWLLGFAGLINLADEVMNCENGELGKCLRNNGVWQAIAESMDELLPDAETHIDPTRYSEMEGLEKVVAELDRRVQAYGMTDFEQTSAKLWEIVDQMRLELEEGSETEESAEESD